MASDDEVPAGLADAVRDLLAAYLTRDSDRCADLVAEINQQHGSRGLYAACCGLASVFVKATGMGADAEDMISLENPDGAPEDDAELWAARFLVAVGNQDYGMAEALFSARLADEGFFTAGLIALLRIVGATVEAKL